MSKIKVKVFKNRGSNVSVLVLLNLLNELGDRDTMRGLLSILFRNELNKFNNTEGRMLNLSYDIKMT